MNDLSGRKVKTVDNALRLFCQRDLISPSQPLDKGVEIQLGTVSVLDGREWVEVALPDGSFNFALGSAVRSHTDMPTEIRNIRQEVAAQPVSAPTPDAPKRSVWPSILGWSLIVFALLGGLQQLTGPGGSGALVTMLLMIVAGIGLILRSGRFAAIGLVSIFGVAIVIAIAVPKMNKNARLAHELGAINQMRTLHQSEAQYYSKYGKYACNLAELGAAQMIPNNIAEGKASGYLFSLSCASAGYAVNANPESFGSSGSRCFYSDQTQVIRNSWTAEPASPNSPEVR
jgi:type IV pilus assembly protein PilA